MLSFFQRRAEPNEKVPLLQTGRQTGGGSWKCRFAPVDRDKSRNPPVERATVSPGQKEVPLPVEAWKRNSGSDGRRSRDLSIFSRTLYQLSYRALRSKTT